MFGSCGQSARETETGQPCATPPLRAGVGKRRGTATAHSPSSAVLSKTGAQGGALFLGGRLKTTTTAAAATATSPPPAERPTDQLPPRPSHRPPGEKVGRKGGGGEKHRTERVQPFPFFPFPPFLTAASPFLHGNCSHQPFFFLSVGLSSLSENSGVLLGECFCLFFFSFLWCRYCFFFLSHDITIIIISIVFLLSRSFFFFSSLLTGVYRTSALITATTTTTASSHYQDPFLFLSSFSSLCVVYHTNFTPLSRCLLFLFLWGICMKWSVQVEKKKLNKGEVIYGELKGRKKMALHSSAANCCGVKNWG